MKLTGLIALVLLSVQAVCAYNLFRTPTPSMQEQIVPVLHDKIANIDLTAMPDSKPRNNEVFSQAMTSLQNLQGESDCHRLAVQLLMNNCRDVEESRDQGLPFKHDAHKNQVEGFITAVTLCFLARGAFDISDACTPFTKAALEHAHQQGKRKLDVSKEQNDACVATLSLDDSKWATWLSQQIAALNICRALQPEIEKDETIFLHKELTRIIAEFVNGLDLDLQQFQQKMAEQLHAVDSRFGSVFDKIEVKVKGAIQVVLGGLEDVSRFIKPIQKNMDELYHRLEVLKKILQRNEEVAAAQEMALVAAKAVAEDASSTVDDLKEALVQLIIPAVISISDRVDATDLKSKLVYEALNNMTYLVNNHTESIEYASFAANDLSVQIKEASEAAKSWNTSSGLGNGAVSLVARLAVAATSVVFGGWGLPPSWIRNLIYLVTSVPTYELIKFMMRCSISDCSLPSAWNRTWFEWIFKSESVASPTQHPGENVGSLVITPLDFEFTEAT